MYLVDDEDENFGNSSNGNCSPTVPTVPSLTNKFKRAFFEVTKHYECSEQEVVEMKAAAIDNYVEAEKFYIAMAERIERAKPYVMEGIAVSAADMVIEPNRPIDTRGK